jgi:cytochrome P450
MRTRGPTLMAQHITAKGRVLAPTINRNYSENHDEYRKIVSPLFMLRELRQFEPLVECGIVKVLDAIYEAGRACNFFSALSGSAISQTLRMRQLGVDTIIPWSDVFTDQIGFPMSESRPVEIVQLTSEYHRAMDQLCEVRRVSHSERDPGRHEAEIITHPADVRSNDKSRLQNGELLPFRTQLMGAGNEANADTLGFALLVFGTDSALLSRPKQDQSLFSTFIEGVLRLHSAFLKQFRKTVGMQMLGGVAPLPMVLLR